MEWDILLTDLMGVPGLDNNKLIIYIKKVGQIKVVILSIVYIH